MRTVGVKGLIG